MAKKCPLGGYVLYLDCLECEEKVCKGGKTVSKDISTMYTKQKNKKAGRRGYGNWKREKEDVISPKQYGQFRGGKRNG